MRVALVPSAFAPTIGGVEELTRQLARRLAATGDDIEVWTPRLGGVGDVDEVDGVAVRRFAMPLPPARLGSIARFPFQGLGAIGAVRAAVRRFRPEVLHVQCFSVNGVYATAVATLHRVPLVVTLQGETLMDDHDIFDRSVALKTGLRIAFRQAAAVTGCSQFVLDDAVRRFGLRPGGGQVIFNGVDLEEHDAGGRSIDVPFERFVLCLGRVVWKKGFDLLLEAFTSVRERVPGVGLVIGGDGPYRPQLEEDARRLGIEEHLHFAGALDRKKVARMMAVASAFVLPSRLEPFGIVVLEAWRAGCPAVVSGIGGTREFVVDGLDGVVVDPHVTSELADALTRVLTDDELRRTLIANGAERVKDFGWPVVAERYRQIYERVSKRIP